MSAPRSAGVGGASSHQSYIPPRRLDQPPRYKGFTPRSFTYASAALALLALSIVFVPQFLPSLSWDRTFPVVAPVAMILALWPRKIRDQKWEEGELVMMRIRRMRIRGRRYRV